MIVYKDDVVNKKSPIEWWTISHDEETLICTKKDLERLYKQLDQILWNEDTSTHNENKFKKS